MYTELQCQHETFTLPCSCDDIAISVVIYVEYPPLNCYFLYNFRKKAEHHQDQRRTFN